METYLTIEGVARHLKLSAQTIRRYVLNREIPFHKIKKVIRFRLSEVEAWVDGGGLDGGVTPGPEDYRGGDLFAGAGVGGAGGEAGEGAAEAGENTEAGGAAASESGGEA
jgi:excisionase family DNA binding protein